VGIAAKRLGELIKFLDGISKKHGAIFHDKAVSLQISSTIYPRRYLSSKKISAQPITVGIDTNEPVRLDDLDYSILSALTSYGALSHRQLSLQIQVPLSTVELRIKKLKQQGVIAAEIYNVDAAKFNMECFKLIVYTKGLDRDLTARLSQFCRAHPNITTLIDCLGSWGYEIGVEAPRPDQLSRIIQQLYEHFGGSIHTIKTLTKFGYPKVRFFIDSPNLGASKR
jgi:DNA-binding Lrp family transcriptional regulator